MSDLCIECRETVSGRKHAVTCDACERWQHRLCNTGEINIFIFVLYMILYLFVFQNLMQVIFF